jgi:nucleoid-associated protein YgaU
MPLPNLPTLAAAPAAVAQPAQAAPAPAPASDADSAQQARTELELAEQRTGLSADQEQRLDRAAMLIRSGDAAAALADLRQLNGQLAGETRFYTVGRDENLRQIAARPEVYGNANLWPLLWRANQARLSQPQQIDQGLRLVVPAHPTVQEAAEAIAYAQSKAVEDAPAPGQPGTAQ